MIACRELSTEVGTAAACRSLDIARPTYYRQLEPEIEEMPAPRPAPPRALSVIERQEVLDALHTDRFVEETEIMDTHQRCKRRWVPTIYLRPTPRT